MTANQGIGILDKAGKHIGSKKLQQQPLPPPPPPPSKPLLHELDHDLKQPCITSRLYQYFEDSHLPTENKMSMCSEFRPSERYNSIRAELDDLFAVDMLNNPIKIVHRRKKAASNNSTSEGGGNQNSHSKLAKDTESLLIVKPWMYDRMGQRRLHVMLDPLSKIEGITDVIKSLNGLLKKSTTISSHKKDLALLYNICGLLIHLALTIMKNPGSYGIDGIRRFAHKFRESALCRDIWNSMVEFSKRDVEDGSDEGPTKHNNAEIEVTLEIFYILEMLAPTYRENLDSQGKHTTQNNTLSLRYIGN